MSASSQTHNAARGTWPPSLFYRDLSASPATRPSAFKGELGIGGRSPSAAMWRDNLGGSEHPPPPVFSLEDRIERSPDCVFGDSPSRSFDSRIEEVRSPPSKSTVLNFGSRTPATGTTSGEMSLGPFCGSSPFQPFTTYRSPDSPNMWSPIREGQSSNGIFSNKEPEKGGGSPVSGVVERQMQSGSLLTLPAMRETVRPDTSFQFIGNATENSDDGDEWVTAFGFGADDTNTVMRELEKCGTIVRHVPGPGGVNWIHVQFQNKLDARRACLKNGMQINVALIVGVKPIDPMQRQALTERNNRKVFNVLPPKALAKGTVSTPVKASARPYYLQPSRGSHAAGPPIASASKSIVSRVVDVVFGL